MSNARVALLSVHAAVLLFGAAGLFGRILTIGPFPIVLGRVVFAAVALAAVLRWRSEPMALEKAGDGLRFLGLGVLLAAHWASFFHAIQLSSVALGLVTFSTFPVFTALLEPVFLEERLSARDVGAALLSLAGVILVVPALDWESSPTRGAAWGVFSGGTFALLSIANRGLVRRYSSLVVAFHQDAWAALVLLPVVLLLPGGWPTPAEWGWLVLLGVVFTAAAHTLFIEGLGGVRASTASVIATLEPVYGTVFAWLLLRDAPAGRTLLGGAVILAAAAWASRSPGSDAPPPLNTSPTAGVPR